MKVHEIINESHINEVGFIANALSKIPGVAKGAELVASVVGKGLVAKSRAVLANSISRSEITSISEIEAMLMRRPGMTQAQAAIDAARKRTEQIESMLMHNVPGMTRAKAAKLAASAKFLKSAERLGASTARAAGLSANIETLRTGLTSVKSAISGLAGLGIPAYMTAQLWEIWSTVYENAELMQADVDSNDLTVAEQASYRRQDIATASVKTAGLFASGVLASMPLGVLTKFFGWMTKLLPRGSKISSTLSALKLGVNTAGALAIAHWINTPEGTKAISDWVSLVLASPLGGGDAVTASADDKLAATFSSIANQSTTPPSAETATAHPDYSNWVYSSYGRIQNPETGEIIDKPGTY